MGERREGEKAVYQHQLERARIEQEKRKTGGKQEEKTLKFRFQKLA